jgi:hypothetical protein
MLRRVPIGITLALALTLAMPVAGCQPDLGDPTTRTADWDAEAPGVDGGGSTNSNNVLAFWQPECGSDGAYPCPLYGIKRGDIIANKIFAAGNPEADFWSNVDGVFSLSDYYQSDSKLLFIYYGRDG